MTRPVKVREVSTGDGVNSLRSRWTILRSSCGGGELLIRHGEPTGSISSAAYGHTLGGAVALGYVQRDDAAVDKAYPTQAKYQVDAAGERCDATVHLSAP